MKTFLPKVATARLRKMHKKEKNLKAAKILLACIYRKDGKTLKEISDIMNESISTVAHWLKRIEERGLNGRRDIKNKGAACKLTSKQLRRLSLNLEKSPKDNGMGAGSWSIPLIRRYIKKKFGVEYNVHSVWDLVRRLGFAYTKPRPHDVRGASKWKATGFKKKAHLEVIEYSRRGYLPVSFDEMHITKRVPIVRKGWHKKVRGRHPTVDVGRRKNGRTTLMGCIGKDGKYYFEFHDAGNTENVRAFFLRAYKKLGKLLVYTDNASYHGEALFEELARETNGGIIVRFLPPYTPELAPIETQWRVIKRFIANLFFDDIEAIKKSVLDGIRRGLIKIVKPHDYLIA